VTARRPLAALALAALLTVGLAACSDDDPAAAPGHGGPTAPDEPLWNPCSALATSLVERLFGGTTTKQAGSATNPACSFTPGDEGGVVLDANYLLYPAGLERAFETFGVDQGDTTVVTSPRIPAADDARVVVDARDDALLVSGFVQNGNLIQTVNLAEPAPFHRARATDGMRALLTRLSRAAEEAGVDEGGYATASPTPDSSPSPSSGD